MHENWSLEDFAKHYRETMQQSPDGWGRYVSPIFGQSHHIIIAAVRRFGVDAVEAAFRIAIRSI